MATAQRGQIQQHGFHRFFDVCGDARAGGQVQTVKPIGQHGATALDVAPAVAQALVGFDGDGVQVRREALAQREVEVGVHEGIFTARSKSLVLRN